MSSLKRKRVETEEEAGPSTPWKKYGLDIDTLTCPICTEIFSLPVFQCVNGHSVCASCCEKMDTKKCPFCSLAIGSIRCLAIEKVMESLMVECKGCKTLLKFHDRNKHEDGPIKCPLHGCTHRGPMCTIPKHLAKVHNISKAEWCESTQTTDFEMWDGKDTAVLVQAKEVWLLISLQATPKGHWFICKTIWASKEGVLKLTAKAFPQTHKRVYTMECDYSHRDHEKHMCFHGHDDSFEVAVSLIARL